MVESGEVDFSGILAYPRSLSDIVFVTRRRRRDQMRGRRPGKTGGVFAEYIEDFFRAENDAGGRGSCAAVERSMSDRLLGPADMP